MCGQSTDAAPVLIADLHAAPRAAKVSSEGMAMPRRRSVWVIVGSSLLKNLAGARTFDELMTGNLNSRNSRTERDALGRRYSMAGDGMHREGWIYCRSAMELGADIVQW